MTVIILNPLSLKFSSSTWQYWLPILCLIYSRCAPRFSTSLRWISCRGRCRARERERARASNLDAIYQRGLLQFSLSREIMKIFWDKIPYYELFIFRDCEILNSHIYLLCIITLLKAYLSFFFMSDACFVWYITKSF